MGGGWGGGSLMGARVMRELVGFRVYLRGRLIDGCKS
jgi:hypothetical protein